MNDNEKIDNPNNEEILDNNKDYNNKDIVNNDKKVEREIKTEENSEVIDNDSNNDKNYKKKEKEINKKLSEYENKIKELQLINNSLKMNVSENQKITANLQNEKMILENTNKQLESNIKILKEKYEQIKSEKETIKSNCIKEINNLKNLLEEMNNKNRIISQATKQIFLQYLTNDIYIEKIEKCFNSQDINKYFDNIYNLSEYIRPNIIIDYWKNILTKNKDLVDNIEKYNLDTSLEIKLKELNKIKKFEDVNKKDNQEFIIQLLQEMNDYITNLRKTIMKQSNTMEEIKNQKKIVENNVNNLIKN